MSKFDWGMYDYSEIPKENTNLQENKRAQNIESKEKSSSFNWDMYDPPIEQQESEEGWLDWAKRTALQVPRGIAQAATYPLDLLQQIGTADIEDPEEIDRIRQASERVGKPFDEEAYLQRGQEAASMFPTVSNASRYLEEEYGIPLEPKTGFQKAVQFASSAGKLSPKGYTLRPLNVTLPRPVLGAGIAGASQAAQSAGVPEPIADIASFLLLKKPTSGATISVKKKPSGLSERQFESIEKPKTVSEGSIRRLNEKIEGEVRELTEKIIEDTPLKDVRAGLKDNAQFKQNASEAIDKVHQLSVNMPGKISRKQITNKYDVKIREMKPKGFALSEYEYNVFKNLEKAKDRIGKRKISTVDLVDQYRKNNAEFGQLKEPGKSFAYNQAKRDSLLIQNRAIADTIQIMHPNSEMANLFKETNERWSRIMGSEAIDEFLDGMFNGKIQFKEGRKFFEKHGVKEPLQKSLGKEGFTRFENLMNDLMSYEKGMNLLKKAKSSGYEEIAKTTGTYLVHPYLAKAKIGLSALKGGYRTILGMFLNSPKIGINWERGINAMKKGDYKAAGQEFAKVKEAAEAVKPSEIKAAPKAAPGSQVKETTIEGKAERVKPSSKTTKSKKATSKSSQEKATGKSKIKTEEKENVGDAFAQMGSGIVDNLYKGIFESLEKGKDTFAGIKEPLISRAKPYYKEGLIKDAKDLKAFSNDPKPFQEKLANLKTKPRERENLDFGYPKLIEYKPSKTPTVEQRKIDTKKPKEPKKKTEEIKKYTLDEVSKMDYEYNPKLGRRELKPKESPKKVEDKTEYTNAKIEEIKKEINRMEEIKAHYQDMKKGATKEDIQKFNNNIESAENHISRLKNSIELEIPVAIRMKQAKTEYKSKKIDTPKKVENKIQNAAERPDITKKGLQTQKAFILHRIEDALANPEKYGKKLEIKVPGDGEFTFKNEPKALEKSKKLLEKKWPDKALPSTRETVYKKKPLPKEMSKAQIKEKIQKNNDEARELHLKMIKSDSEFLRKKWQDKIHELDELLKIYKELYENAKD